MGSGPSYNLPACRKVARITYRAFRFLPRYIVIGITEKQLAWRMGRLLTEAYSEQRAFPVIAAFGSSAAEPHHKPTSRRLQLGDMVKVDAGGVYQHMRGDVTRTYFMGAPTSLFRTRFYAVLQAQRLAFKKIKPGVTGNVVDQVARQYLQSQHLDKLFIHGLGHGVGRAIHQPPFLSPSRRGRRLLQIGDVITDEPGVYEPGWGGIRLEDMVEVTKAGGKWLGEPVRGIDEIII
ncbi:MAG: M24 family metallopeptidase [Patescibacteria group bacterium]|jgi:Xaa-Pro aminopeptidase